MPDYHIGTLDEAARTALAGGDEEDQPDPSRAVFLQSKSWTKALLQSKTRVSPDSFIFTFKLDHDDQDIGLPTGQHLMLRLRDPATREAIIRAYTPLSESHEKGYLRILIKVYYDTPERKGGRMTQALDAIPPGHFVEFKGPVGKFEYLGRGKCTVSGQARRIRRFVMICGGSGITPIFQVLRAVLNDREDQTECLVLDGNRDEQDILCRTELDGLAAENAQRFQLIYTLTRPGPEWKGLTGRVDEAFLSEKVGAPPSLGEDAGEDMVLVCGPEPMEKSVKTIFGKMGWGDSQLLFF